MTLHLVSGAGNRFAIADGFGGSLDQPPGDLAGQLAGRVDGLLLMDPAPGGIRMTLYNCDGSRAEACGNGLRCVAALAVGAGYVAGPEVLVQTDAGPRRVTVAEGGEQATAEMGPAVLGTAFDFEHEGLRLEVLPVHLGNPHAVALVHNAQEAPLGVVGPALERHPRFPGRTNVELFSPDPDGLGVQARVWERGVGETLSCGTGACAVACAASKWLGLGSPIEVAMPGGGLRVEWTTFDALALTGAIRHDGRIEP